MQTDGDYITDRFLPQIVRRICCERGIECRVYSEDWVLELSRGDDRWYISGYTFDINRAAATAVANDKVAAYQLMAARNVDAVEHYLYRVSMATEPISPWRKVVVKPLTGTGGRNVRAFTDRHAAYAYMKQSGIDGWAVSPYIAIMREVRMILFDDELLLSYEKIPADGQGNELILFNLGKGAVPVPFTPDNSLLLHAQAARTALGLRLAAVDCVKLASGEWRILEVNTGIMMEQYARISPEFFQQATAVYRRIVDAMVEMSSK